MVYELQHDPVDIEYKEICRKWIRILKALRAENACLIDSLAGALKGTMRRPFVEEAEQFQLTILDREEVLVLLRHEVAELLEWLENRPQERPAPQRYVSLKRDMEMMVGECERAREAFLIFMASVKV